MKKYIAHNIKWDTDGDMKLFKTLPQEIEIPEEALDYLNSLLRKGEDIVQSKVDLDNLFNKILIKKVGVIFGKA